MNINHLISDSIARIKNGYMKSYISVSIIKSKFIIKFIQSLENEGFIQGYVEEKHTLKVFLKYTPSSESVIKDFKVISTPGSRIYFGLNDLMDWKHKTNTFETLILSTTKGVFSDNEALKQGVGGEVLCIIK